MFSVPPIIAVNKKLISLINNRYLSEYRMRIFFLIHLPKKWGSPYTYTHTQLHTFCISIFLKSKHFERKGSHLVFKCIYLHYMNLNFHDTCTKHRTFHLEYSFLLVFYMKDQPYVSFSHTYSNNFQIN